MEKTCTKENDLKSFIKGQISMKGSTLTETAEGIGKTQSTLSGMLIRNTMSVKTLVEILDHLGEEMVIVLKDGNKYKIEM